MLTLRASLTAASKLMMGDGREKPPKALKHMKTSMSYESRLIPSASQPSHKQPPLLHDKVVAYRRWSVEKIRKISSN